MCHARLQMDVMCVGSRLLREQQSGEGYSAPTESHVVVTAD